MKKAIGYVYVIAAAVCWGFLGLILARAIHPPVETIVVALPFGLLIVVDVLLSAMFVSDVAVSVRTALDLARMLEELDKLREQSAELRKQLSETALVQLTRLSYRVDEARGEWSEKMDDAREQLSERMGGAREQISERVDGAREQFADAKEQILARLDELQNRFDEQAAGLGRIRKSMLRGNPTARSARYDAVLQRLKKRIDTRRHD